MAAFNSDSQPDDFLNANDYENDQMQASEGDTSRHGQSSGETSTPARQTDTTNDKLHLKRRFGGAFKYNTKLQKSWTKTWPFVPSVPSDDHKFRCNVCAKVIWL